MPYCTHHIFSSMFKGNGVAHVQHTGREGLCSPFWCLMRLPHNSLIT